MSHQQRSWSIHFYRRCIMAVACFWLVEPALAATFNVTNLNDAGAGSLRDALFNANAASDTDVIDFQAGLSGTITLTTGVLNITNPVEIRGPGDGLLSVSGNDTSRVFQVGTGVAVTIRGLAIRLGRSPLGTGSQGGCIFSAGQLTLSQCAISQCTAVAATAVHGGGVYSSGTLIMDECTVHNCMGSSNTFGAGGGIAGTGGSMTLRRTTVHDNQMNAGTVVQGGGLYTISTAVTMENCTIANNGGSAVFPDAGGFWIHSGTLFMNHCTVAGNTSGAGANLASSTLYIRNSLLASNGGGQFAGTGSQVISLGNNLVSTGGGGLVHGVNGDQIGTDAAPIDPLLLPLGDYGGHTPTMALEFKSPAVDAGNPTQPPITDQRGFARAADGNCMGEALPDIGAFEYGGGDGLNFDGINDTVAVSFQQDLNLASAFTLEAWERPRLDSPGFQVSRVLSTRSFDDRGYGFGILGGSLLFTTFGVQDFHATNAKLLGDVWTHVAVVFDSMFDASFYVNGVFVQKVDGVQSARTHMVPRPLFLGANPVLAPQFWNGVIGEVRIWKTERTPGQIAKFYDVPLSGDEANLVAYWRFNEGQGLDVFDQTFKGHEGLLINDSYWLGPACIPDACVAGDANDDGLVTLADARALVMNLGRPGATLRQGDLDGDADVDLQDFATLQLQFGLSCH